MRGRRTFSPINPNDNNKNLVLLYVYYPTNCCGSVIPHSGTILAFGAGQTTRPPPSTIDSEVLLVCVLVYTAPPTCGSWTLIRLDLYI